MAGWTTAFPVSLKAELPQAIHNFQTTTGHVYKVALGTSPATGTYDSGTVNYSNLTGNLDEVNTGSVGYSAGGFAFTAAQNLTPSTATAVAYWQWNTNPSWAGATFTTLGCLIYNASATNRAVYIGSFGGVQVVTSGTFTLSMPTNGSATALLRIS